jgi:hypothetical protein
MVKRLVVEDHGELTELFIAPGILATDYNNRRVLGLRMLP